MIPIKGALDIEVNDNKDKILKDVKIGFALTGSFCTLDKAIKAMEDLYLMGADIYPIISENVKISDTRFGTANSWREKILLASGKDSIIESIIQAEPIGPKSLFDIVVIAPCSGNTLGKLANGIVDTTVLMAAKAHLRSLKPLVLAISTNDGLSGSCKNIGLLLNYKNIFFVPFGQDNPVEKTNSLVSDMGKIPETIRMALTGRQIQPILLEYHK